MKQTKKEIDMLGLINEMQTLLIALDKKVDSLLFRSISETSPIPKLPVAAPPLPKTNDRNKARIMYTAICADCNKNCEIPFKPNGERPVYCKDCFSRRKVISLSRIGLDPKPIEAPPVLPAAVKPKKKAVPVKKTVTKKKSAPKRK